jgi:hypothetical protein
MVVGFTTTYAISEFSTSSCQSSQKSSSSSSLPYFACHDVVALIVIQPFAIGQPLHVKFRCLSIFFILLRFLPLASKKWFGPVKVLPLLDQMSSEVQGTFGITAMLLFSSVTL